MIAVTMPPASVTYIARLASPTARKAPENPIPRAINTLEGRVI